MLEAGIHIAELRKQLDQEREASEAGQDNVRSDHATAVGRIVELEAEVERVLRGNQAKDEEIAAITAESDMKLQRQSEIAGDAKGSVEETANAASARIEELNAQLEAQIKNSEEREAASGASIADLRSKLQHQLEIIADMEMAAEETTNSEKHHVAELEAQLASQQATVSTLELRVSELTMQLEQQREADTSIEKEKTASGRVVELEAALESALKESEEKQIKSAAYIADLEMKLQHHLQHVGGASANAEDRSKEQYAAIKSQPHERRFELALQAIGKLKEELEACRDERDQYRDYTRQVLSSLGAQQTASQ